MVYGFVNCIRSMVLVFVFGEGFRLFLFMVEGKIGVGVLYGRSRSKERGRYWIFK